MTRAAWLALAAALALAVPAYGQSTRYRPPPEDFDRPSEQQSKLWERVLHPHRGRYQAQVSRAEYLAGRSDDAARQEAADVLRQAIALAPEQPLAYWLLGSLEEQRERWTACLDALSKLHALDPGYQPADTPPRSGKRSDLELDFKLATCAAGAGELELAVTHYTRILGRGITDHAPVHLRLGEAYLALGRLAEAIAALTVAQRLQPGNWRIHYSLAVAYDRDEKEAQARAALREALRYDPDLARLEAPDARFAPAVDALYYQGLARAGRGDIEWAIAYFRHYLHITGHGPWRRRAEQHLADLERQAMRERFEITGTASLDAPAVARALASVGAALRQCVAATPGLLLEVRITATGSARQLRTPGASRLTSGVKAQILHSFATEPEQADRAQQCVETVAETIALPQPAGADRYAMVRFLLLAPTVQPARER